MDCSGGGKYGYTAEDGECDMHVVKMGRRSWITFIMAKVCDNFMTLASETVLSICLTVLMLSFNPTIVRSRCSFSPITDGQSFTAKLDDNDEEDAQ